MNLLSDDELAAMDTTALLARQMKKMLGDGHDWLEACDKIHQIQHAIMAQAAARAYPDLFRLHGEEGYGDG